MRDLATSLFRISIVALAAAIVSTAMLSMVGCSGGLGGAAPGLFGNLLGQAAAGVWRLCVGDDAAQDTGSLGEVRLGIGRSCADGEQDNDLDGTCTVSCESGEAGCAPEACVDATGTAVCP